MARSDGRWDEAEECFRHAVDGNPANPFYQYRLAEANEHLGRIDSAAHCALRAVRLKPDEAPIQTLTGILLLRQGQVPRGMQHLAAAHRLDPSALEPVVNLGIMYGRTNRHDSACAYFAKAIRLAPQRPEYYDAFITSSLAQGLCRQAEAALIRLTEIRPGYARIDEHRKALAACRSAQQQTAP
jgi:tetratricopeptide (TPR) repeat protein